ncbi:MAG: 50S ribosomal protein L17 [Alphaproteobacteria bacterium GM7ARS4]|nr:50S ribosomal protein L17 [Alphaproteobacteria bacterium GM7ARS4]
MRHRMKGRMLGRTSSERRALLSSLANAIIEHESIKTTLPKAKEARPVVEKMITLAKKGTLHQRRQAFAFLRRGESVKKLWDELAQRYRSRQGGYTRIVKAGFRYGDGAAMAIIELMDRKPHAEQNKKGGTSSK